MWLFKFFLWLFMFMIQTFLTGAIFFEIIYFSKSFVLSVRVTDCHTSSEMLKQPSLYQHSLYDFSWAVSSLKFVEWLKRGNFAFLFFNLFFSRNSTHSKSSVLDESGVTSDTNIASLTLSSSLRFETDESSYVFISLNKFRRTLKLSSCFGNFFIAGR